MAQGDPQGWESLGANDPLLYKANLRLNRETGGGQTKQNIKVVTNRDNGNYDVYSTAFGAGDKKLFGYNASDNKIVVDPNNRATYDQFFTGPRSQQLTDLNKSVKQATLKLAENNVSGGSGSASQAALDRLKNGPGYKPTAAAPKITPPGANPNGADPAAGGAASGGGLTKEAAIKLKADLGNERSGTRNEFPGARGSDPLVYPITLRQDFQDVIKFSMIKYAPRALDARNEGKDLSPFAERRAITLENTIGTVILPIPNGITDTNSCDWGSNSTDVFGSELFNIANSFIVGGGESGVAAVGGAVSGAAGNTGAIAASLSTKFAEAASGTTNMLSRTQGAVQNPNMELLFNGPTLRPFNFTFKLASRSETESKTIRSIIRFFKQGMSPIRTQSQLFLKAPHTFQMQYLHRGEEHKFLNQFKECALQSFSVSYTPEGQYATFQDGAMVSYQITMQFSELEPVFNDDYTNDGKDPSPNIGL
jgi:hypothetical protein